MKKIQANKLDENAKHSMLARIITAIGIALVSIPCIILGSWYFFALFLIIGVLGAVELTLITDLKGGLKTIISIITVVCTVAIIYYVFYYNKIRPLNASETIAYTSDAYLTSKFSTINISVMLVTLMAAIYFVICFTVPGFTVAHVFYYVTMVIVVAIGIQSIMCLRYSPFFLFNLANPGTDLINTDSFKYGQSMFLFLYVLIGVIMNDIGAYFIGVLFGKHKMNEKISPKKTWEGFLGGIVFSLIASTAFAIIVTYCGKPMLPIFDFSEGQNPYAVFFVIGISLLLPLLADVGDFIFSAIKRYWGVKDFSNLLPGHGGILDRIDSLLFSAALVSCLLIFIYLVFYGIEL